MKINECICGMKNVHTMICKRHNRRLYLRSRSRNKRLEKRKKGLCIYGACKNKGEVEVIVHQYCKKHRTNK